jgi:hypothetical protein
MPRKLIRDGEMTLAVQGYEPARIGFESLLKEVGGYVSSSQVHHDEGDGVAQATFVLRVPAGRFDEFAHKLSELGNAVSESTRTDDVSEQYYDLAARLANAKKLEARLRELVTTRAVKVTELLEVERELGRVREQSEVLEGKLRLYDSQVEMSTLTLHLVIYDRHVRRAPSLAHDASETLSESWQALRHFARGLILVGVALLPWLPVLALFVWLVVRWSRRRARAASLPPEPR